MSITETSHATRRLPAAPELHPPCLPVKALPSDGCKARFFCIVNAS